MNFLRKNVENKGHTSVLFCTIFIKANYFPKRFVTNVTNTHR